MAKFTIDATVEACSCAESQHLRAALEAIGRICTDGPDNIQSWLNVATLVDAGLELKPLPLQATEEQGP